MISDAADPQDSSQSLAAGTSLRLERRALQRPGNPFTVLLIEDDATVRALVRRHLTQDGYLVLEAEDGQAGLEVLQEYAGRIDVVLTDLDMPRIDGITVAGVLGALRPLVGVVCMSGTTNQWGPMEGLSALSPQRFLAKPFTPERLTHVLNDELTRVQALAEIAESSHSVSRTFPDEQRLMLAVDVVASGLRLQSFHANRTPAPPEALQA